MQTGKFLKPEKLPFSRKQVLQRGVIPDSALPLSQEDLLLLPERSRSAPRTACLSDRCLSDYEETARRGLESISIMDTFLGGLVSSLKDPASDTFTLRASPDPSAIVLFIQSMSEGLKYAAGAFSTLPICPLLWILS